MSIRSSEIALRTTSDSEEVEKVTSTCCSHRLRSTAEFWWETWQRRRQRHLRSRHVRLGMVMRADLGVTVPALSALDKCAVHAPLWRKRTAEISWLGCCSVI